LISPASRTITHALGLSYELLCMIESARFRPAQRSEYRESAQPSWAHLSASFAGNKARASRKVSKPRQVGPGPIDWFDAPHREGLGCVLRKQNACY
jgi:hypothetical protein